MIQVLLQGFHFGIFFQFLMNWLHFSSPQFFSAKFGSEWLGWEGGDGCCRDFLATAAALQSGSAGALPSLPERLRLKARTAVGARDGAGGVVGHQHPHCLPCPRPFHPLQLRGRPDCLELQGEQWEGEQGGCSSRSRTRIRRGRGKEAGARHHHRPLPAQAGLSVAFAWIQRTHLGQWEKPDLPRWVS